MDNILLAPIKTQSYFDIEKDTKTLFNTILGNFETQVSTVLIAPLNIENKRLKLEIQNKDYQINQLKINWEYTQHINQEQKNYIEQLHSKISKRDLKIRDLSKVVEQLQQSQIQTNNVNITPDRDTLTSFISNNDNDESVDPDINYSTDSDIENENISSPNVSVEDPLVGSNLESGNEGENGKNSLESYDNDTTKTSNSFITEKNQERVDNDAPNLEIKHDQNEHVMETEDFSNRTQFSGVSEGSDLMDD